MPAGHLHAHRGLFGGGRPHEAFHLLGDERGDGPDVGGELQASAASVREGAQERAVPTGGAADADHGDGDAFRAQRPGHLDRVPHVSVDILGLLAGVGGVDEHQDVPQGSLFGGHRFGGLFEGGENVHATATG